MIELRPHEFLLKECAGGTCSVCKMKINPGNAVQLSRYTSRIRHVECEPKQEKYIKRISAKAARTKNGNLFRI